MQDHDVFWNLGALSDRQLLERVGVLLGSTRRLTAELIAHLGEVEERRLHLLAACSSMFAYCLKLGMTEDEAYRRIEVARLARRYPVILPRLAKGQLSISVVALLKHHLSVENHVELLAAASGKSVAQTRELIATRFPRPDVASSVRQLPEPRTTIQRSLAMSDAPKPRPRVEEPSTGGTQPSRGGTQPSAGGKEPSAGGTHPSAGTQPSAGGTQPSTGGTQPSAGVARSPHSQRVMVPRVASRIEPLSAQSYKVQFTAGAELARKLGLARDLMRHSYPGGELGVIVERALDVLIESLMQRRFGKKATSKRTGARAGRTAPEHRSTAPEHRSTAPEHRSAGMGDPFATHGAAEPDIPTHDIGEPSTATTRAAVEHAVDPNAATMGDAATMRDTADVLAGGGPEMEGAPVTSYTPRSSRRTVVERDGLSCSWVDEQGARCGSQAWLEYDHRLPRAKGGGSKPDNLRLLCRNHNRFAAEREYGRTHVERAIAERRRARAPQARPR